MVLLVDTNVILNFITGRNDQYLKQSIEVVKRCANNQYEGFIAFHTLPTLWYVLRSYNDQIRRECLENICEIFQIAITDKAEILEAIKNDHFKDFEDCLQDKCAKNINADYIVTCNVKDFINSEVPSITPDDLIKLF